MKNLYTIFGQGFVGINIVKFLKQKKYKFFIPKKGTYKFNKNLHNIIYCIGNDNWIKDPKGSFEANFFCKFLYGPVAPTGKTTSTN